MSNNNITYVNGNLLKANNNITHVNGDLLKANVKVIVQQLNCLCVKPHGLSAVISSRFPYANVYGKRRSVGKKNFAVKEDHGVPGEIVISMPNQNDISSGNCTNPIVIGLYGQYDYGKPGKSWRSTLAQDNFLLREKWFKESLLKLREWMIREGYKEVAFPYGIGCGLGGGKWKKYYQMIQEFAEDAPYKVLIYKL